MIHLLFKGRLNQFSTQITVEKVQVDVELIMQCLSRIAALSPKHLRKISLLFDRMKDYWKDKVIIMLLLLLLL